MIGCIEEAIPSSGGDDAQPRGALPEGEPSDYVTQIESSDGDDDAERQEDRAVGSHPTAHPAYQIRLVAAQTMRCARSHSCDIFFCAHYEIDQAALYTAEPGARTLAKICDGLAASQRAAVPRL
jgi:hypothetical protein